MRRTRAGRRATAERREAMTQVSEALGQKIREIRKNRRCTLEELGRAVHKSKATLSKYETGDIVIDVETLCEIARALRVSVFSLMNLPVGESRAEPPEAAAPGGLFASPLVYLYYYGGEEKAVHRSVIERCEDGGAKLYHEVASFEDYCLCSKVYKGTVQEYSFYTRLPFENEFCRLDRITMIFPSMLNGQNFLLGHLLMMNLSNQPVGVKALAANHVMAEDRRFRSMLQVSREELRRVRRTNYFTIDRVSEAEA